MYWGYIGMQQWQWQKDTAESMIAEMGMGARVRGGIWKVAVSTAAVGEDSVKSLCLAMAG